MNIIENIKEIRLKNGVTQQLISDALGVDVAVVSNIEKGKRELKVCELEKIANVFEMRVIDLFTYPQKYVEQSTKKDEDVEAILQIKLKKDKKDQVLKLVFGENNIEILNK